jgi:5-methylcytosine-specific restriction endonuclease McrA
MAVDNKAYQKRYRTTHETELRNYRQARKGHKKRLDRQWRKRHSLKSLARLANRSRNGSITAFGLWKIAKKQKLRCALSGEKLTSENISVDHITPRSKGGFNILSNVRLTTRLVNMARRDSTDADFISMCRTVMKFNLIPG